jgi:DNA-binding response OmpR family regulator
MRLNEADMSTTHKTRQILVVDDDEMIREMSKMMLSLLGYKANAVPSGEAALEYLKKNSVDLVLLDMALGKGMDGLDTYLRILELNENQKAIIISGYSEPERLKQAQLLGADYVRKPFDMRTIGAAVQAQFGKEKI